MKTTEKHSFKRGQKLRLDDIYTIQGLAGGAWWTAPDPYDDGKESEEDVTILEDITITVTVNRPNAKLSDARGNDL